MRSRILVIPAVPDLDAFSRLVANLGHYFGHLKPERIVILVDSALLPEAREWLRDPTLPPAFGEAVGPRIAAVRPKLVVKAWPTDLDGLAVASDLVLDWDIRASEADPWKSLKERYRPDRTLFSVDWQGVRLGAARFADAARIVAHGRAFDRSQAAALGSLAQRLGRAERAYLVGTGPSAREALDRDLSDGVRIVCNTLVLDAELMDHVRPQVLAIADPIFHFGPSTYAQRFQQALAEQAQKHDFSVVTTERYAPLLRAHLPELAPRVIGLRQGGGSWPDNFDLLAHPAVRPYPNVLTMLMLPLAATLARSIGLIGFDGRAPTDDYFWRHGPTVQFDEELRDIRLVHPGFFELSYADYYSDHIAIVERLFTGVEERGVEVRPMAESFIPALRRRSMAPLTPGLLAAAPPQPTLVSLTPDWINDFGHFGPFERRVHEVAEATAKTHVALASGGLQTTADWQLPAFSEPTFSSTGRFAPVGRHFERELRAALGQLELGPEPVVFLYTADVWHLPGVLAVAVERPAVRFVVNLMRSHPWLDRALNEPDAWTEAMVDLLEACLAAAAHLHVEVTVDTEALARDVELLTGHRVAVWPMIVVSDTPPAGSDARGTNGEAHIVAPVQAQGGKGFPELVALAERMHGRLERGELRLTARWPADGMQSQIVRLAERFEEHGGHLVRDNLTDAAFVDLVASADVALIPYRVRPFRTRTSAVTLDALLAGKPIVAVRGTWAGDLIERYGAGLTYPDGDVEGMDRALLQVLGNIGAYRRRVGEVRDTIRAEHAPERLLDFLGAKHHAPAPDPEAGARVLQIHEKAARLDRLFQWHAAAEDATRMTAVVREDDQHRFLETSRDEVDTLKRAIRHRDRAKATPAPSAAAPQASAMSAGGVPQAKGAPPARAGEQAPAAASTRARRFARRRRGLRRAISGSMLQVVVLSLLLALVAGLLAVGGYESLALVALAVSIVTSLTGSLVVAVRLERRP